MAKKKKNDKKNKPTPVSRGHYRTILSLLLSGSGLMLLLAQFSYLLYWKIDQSATDLEHHSENVQNWLGKIGNEAGHFFIFEGYGIATILIALMLILSGLYVFARKSMTRLSVKWIWTFVLIFMISTGLAIFFPSYPILSGVSANELIRFVMHFTGKWGTPLLWVLLSVLLAIYHFKWEPEHITAKLSGLKPAKPFSLHIKMKKPSDKHGTNHREEPVEPAVNEKNGEVPENEKADEKKDKDFDTLLKIKQNVDEVPEEIEPAEDAAPSLKVEVGREDKIQTAQSLVEEFGEFDPTLDLPDYKYPHFDLLNDYDNDEIVTNTEEIYENNQRIVKTLKDFDIEISQIEATVGPSVTLYEIIPKRGTRISKIRNLEDDIALSLSALGIRIIAPMPGKGTIGIEVPNKKPALVPIKKVLRAKNFQTSDMELPVALGKTISNSTYVFDLTKMPHLLMAGSTGQGKSVGLNVILNSILFKKHPAEVKFVLIDPKKVELALYKKIEKHFLAKLPDEANAIINDVTKVKDTLNSLVKEMENRYLLLEKAQVRNIKEYNRKFKKRLLNPQNGHRYLPYIVLVIDEYGDFIMTAGKEVETPIARLAQMARAVGIHMIIATQRPSVNIITGIIKANFPARIAFRVASKIDSRTILDQSGAEKLVGKGDMLITRGNELVRVQCAFIDTDEVQNVVSFIGDQRGYPEAYQLPEPEREDGGVADFDDEDRDPLFEEAARIIVAGQQGSASLLQRKLKIGYNRAGRLIDQMERAGIVGPSQGSKPREVYITDFDSLDRLLNKNE